MMHPGDFVTWFSHHDLRANGDYWLTERRILAGEIANMGQVAIPTILL